MPPSSSPASLLQILYERLEAAHQRNDATAAYNAQGDIIQVPGIGKALSSAYEQLRNAAEYTEEHLLLQRAVRRYYYRSLSFSSKRQLHKNIGEELIVELTQAGYLHNNQYGKHVAQQLQQLVAAYMEHYWALRASRASRDKAVSWTLDELSVSTEEILNPHFQLNALAYVAYYHYLQELPKAAFLEQPQDSEQYEICLYIAVHRSLLKSDVAIVRHDLIQMYQLNNADIQQYIEFNRQLDNLFQAPLTQRLLRAMSRFGAPMRVLKSMVIADSTVYKVLPEQEAFMHAYRRQVSKEYKDLKKRLNKGIIKSIAFIFITKVVIGLGIEVPYDLLFVGSVAILPLVINLLVPPLYMASLKLGLRTPSNANATALGEYMEHVLYPNGSAMPHLPITPKTAPASMKILYSILFFIPFAITVYILSLLHFNLVQGVIFFTFLSTASFLGFRLARMIRELELVVKQQNLISTVRDFFYMPFILVGQWLSSKYAKVNAVAFILDMAIELPMKTMMRLTRQWTRFLNEKHDELY